jgi:hypothetical protein
MVLLGSDFMVHMFQRHKLLVTGEAWRNENGDQGTARATEARLGGARRRMDKSHGS